MTLDGHAATLARSLVHPSALPAAGSAAAAATPSMYPPPAGSVVFRRLSCLPACARGSLGTGRAPTNLLIGPHSAASPTPRCADRGPRSWSVGGPPSGLSLLRGSLCGHRCPAATVCMSALRPFYDLHHHPLSCSHCDTGMHSTTFGREELWRHYRYRTEAAAALRGPPARARNAREAYYGRKGG